MAPTGARTTTTQDEAGARASLAGAQAHAIMAAMADNDTRQGKGYADAAILAYVNKVHAGHDEALDRAFAAPDREGMPAIMLGPSEARLLELLMRMIRAERVVEIGTLAGYSALRLAAGLGQGGKLWSIEMDPEHARVARANIEAAGYGDRVEVMVGSALELLPGLAQHGPFDAVFLDADKESYDRYGQWAADNLRPGGLLLGDNAYLFGHLLEDSGRGRHMRGFHEQTAEAFDSVCIPTPDGLVLGIKR